MTKGCRWWLCYGPLCLHGESQSEASLTSLSFLPRLPVSRLPALSLPLPPLSAQSYPALALSLSPLALSPSYPRALSHSHPLTLALSLALSPSYALSLALSPSYLCALTRACALSPSLSSYPRALSHSHPLTLALSHSHPLTLALSLALSPSYALSLSLSPSYPCALTRAWRSLSLSLPLTLLPAHDYPLPAHALSLLPVNLLVCALSHALSPSYPRALSPLLQSHRTLSLPLTIAHSLTPPVPLTSGALSFTLLLSRFALSWLQVSDCHHRNGHWHRNRKVKQS